MKKSKDVNDVDVSHLKLKRGEIRVFKGLRRKKDKNALTGFYLPSAVRIPKQDAIMIDGDIKDIAAIRNIGVNGSIKYHDLWLRRESGGVISCVGGRIADQEKYEYLMLSNYRKGNPNRDPSIKQIYELVDVQADAKTTRATRTQRLKAMNYANDMDNDEVATFAAASGWGKDQVEIQRNRIEIMSETDPVHFLKIASNRQNNIKADIKNALDKGFITFDKPSSKFTWTNNGELITTVPRSTKGNHLDGILHFIINSDHGEAVYQEVKLLLAGKVDKAMITMGDGEEKAITEAEADEMLAEYEIKYSPTYKLKGKVGLLTKYFNSLKETKPTRSNPKPLDNKK